MDDSVLPLALRYRFLYLLIMELPLPDGLLEGLDMTEDQLRLDLALGLYVDNRVSLGRAAEIAGISKPSFLDALGARRIPISYDLTDLENDVNTIASLRAARLSNA